MATTLFFVFVLPLNEAVSFAPPTDAGSVFRKHLTRLAFALALWCLLRWAIRFGFGVLDGDPHYRRWLSATGVYLLVLVPIFIAIYPGHWVYDEYDTIYLATHWAPGAWQGYLTYVYYVFCLFLLPSKVGIVVVQMLFAAVVAGYVVTLLAGRLRHRWLSAFVLLALLSPAVLLNDFYPLRLTAYAYLLVLVLAHLLHRSGGDRRSRPSEFFAVCCAVAVLAFWRSEGIATLALLPVAFVVLGMTRLGRAAPRRLVGVTLAGLLAITCSGWVSTATVDPRYRLSAMLNPLSTMLASDARSPHLHQDLEAIDGVVDVEKVRSLPSYLETPSFNFAWEKQDPEAHTAAFTRAYVDLVVNNPGLFLENRWHAFLAANSQQHDWAPQVGAAGINGSDPMLRERFATFEQSTPFATAWNLPLKYQTARHLFLLDSTLHPTIWTSIIWNSTWSILIALIALAYGLIRRRPILATSAAVLIASGALVFLSEPAAYFMYFFPVYLAGLLGGAVALGLKLDAVLTGRAESSRRTAGIAASIPSSTAPHLGR